MYNHLKNKIKFKIMKTLTNNRFKQALQSLEIHFYTGLIQITDDHGEVASYKPSDDKIEISDVITIFDDEFDITDVQKEMLYNMLMAAKKEYSEQEDRVFTQEDYAHFTNILYS